MRLALPLSVLLLALVGCGSSQTTGPANPSPTTSARNPALAPGGQNHVHSIAIMPGNPATLYLGTHYHLYKSTNGGVTWHALNTEMMLSMALDSAQPSTIYGVSLQKGLQESTDNGAHWFSPTHVIPAGNAVGVAYDPATDVILAFGAGIYRRQGSAWTHVLKGQSVTSVAVGAPDIAYAATDNGLFVSHNDGKTWTGVSSLTGQPIIQVAVSGATAYAVTPLSLIMSANNGRSWRTLSKAPQNIQFIGVAPSDPKEVIAEVGATGFMATYDGGQTWHGANKGIGKQDFNAGTVRVAPSSPRVMYTGSWGVHFFASTDGGKHWVQRSTLPH